MENKKAYSKEIQLTQSNYYSNDANWHYRSKSQYWNFLQCEAKALAELKGEYKENFNQDSLLFGNYLHSFFESYKSHKRFINQHKKSLYKYGNKSKGLKKTYLQADKCIKALIHDDYFKMAYKGEKEVIVKGKIDGVNWMGKIDCLNLDLGVFLDLKTVDDIHKKHWIDSEHRYGNFIEARGYVTQMAIYQELIKQTFGKTCMPYIVAVSKQDTPDKAILSINQSDLDDALNDVIMKQDHVNKVINGEAEPRKCGHCDYCRMHKSLNKIVNYHDIILN